VDFYFTEEQRLLRDSVRKFLAREWSKENERECDEKGVFPFELVKKMARMGLLGTPFSEQYGGYGGNTVDFVIVLEELARIGFAAVGSYELLVGFSGQQIQYNGSTSQKAFYLPKIIQGEMICALGLTESEAGSDAAAVRTTALKRKDVYVLNGTKVFTSGATFAHRVITLARTEPQAGRKHEGLTMFIVDTVSPGFSARPIDKLGTKAIPFCEVVFEDVEVPEQEILGGEEGLNKGWEQIVRHLDNERIMLAAKHIGEGALSLSEAVHYAKEREQFGQRIIKFQGIGHTLADLATELEAARLLVYYAAWLRSRDLPCRKEAAMAKLMASEVSKKIAINGMQILGGYGYTMEFDMQRNLRNALMGTIGGGTSQIMRTLIARDL